MTNDARYQAQHVNGATSSQTKQVLDEISQALSGLRFGSIEIVVHEGKVTQIERKEKFRIQT
jgi:hypothetical protein